MATNNPHGVTSQEQNGGMRPIKNVTTATIGILCTANDADDTVFPYDTPVLLTSIKSKIGYAGKTGTLYPSLKAILSQGDTRAIVVRVKEGATEAETTANVLGTVEGNKRTGMQAFYDARVKCKDIPAIMGIPEYDTLAVAQELIAIAQTFKAFVYVHAPDTDDITEVAAYRQNFSQREVMIIDDHFLVANEEGEPVRGMTVAIALGLRAYIDSTTGWHKTISNVAVNGVVGIERGRTWELSETTHDLHYLNNNQVTGLICDAGYYFWGNWTTSDDPLFQFENYTRTAQIMIKTFDSQLKWAIDKPMSVGLIKSICDVMKTKIDEWTFQGKLLGGDVWVELEDNDTNNVKSGKFTIRRNYTPVPPLSWLQNIQEITDEYIVEFVNGVITAVNKQ